MKLDLSDAELGAMVADAIERVVREKLSGAIEAIAMEQARERMAWRSTAELAEEFRIPERTIRFLHEQKKLTKSCGLGEKQPRFLRQDLIDRIEEKAVKSTVAIAREKEGARKVTKFPNPPASRAG